MQLQQLPDTLELGESLSLRRLVSNDFGVSTMRSLCINARSDVSFILEPSIAKTIEAYSTLDELSITNRLAEKYEGNNADLICYLIMSTKQEPIGCSTLSKMDTSWIDTFGNQNTAKTINLSMWLLQQERKSGYGKIVTKLLHNLADRIILSNVDGWQKRAIATSIRYQNFASQKLAILAGLALVGDDPKFKDCDEQSRRGIWMERAVADSDMML
jgi:L-amino acid N-acyltransferase YncA